MAIAGSHLGFPDETSRVPVTNFRAGTRCVLYSPRLQNALFLVALIIGAGDAKW
jgi:hypothetical protein